MRKIGFSEEQIIGLLKEHQPVIVTECSAPVKIQLMAVQRLGSEHKPEDPRHERRSSGGRSIIDVPPAESLTMM